MYIKPETDIVYMVIENLMGEVDSTGDTEGKDTFGNTGSFNQDDDLTVEGKSGIWED